jgi:DNA replication protein DnaC
MKTPAMILTEPRLLTNPCPHCNQPVEYYAAPDLPGIVPLCEACGEIHERNWNAEQMRQRWLRMLKARMPEDYRSAVPSLIPAELAGVMEWNRFKNPKGLGVIGKSGKGKSCAVACLVAWLKMTFRWWSGTQAREVYTAASKSDDATQGPARQWADAMASLPLLVLDDISQTKFTESWSSALYSLLESRANSHLPTLWTMQITGAELRAKIIRDNGGDAAQASAIIGRLTRGMKHVVVA